MSEIEDLRLFTWVGEDDTGLGVKTFVTRLGLSPMLAANIQTAERPEIAAQARAIADKLGKPVYLVKLKVVEIVRVVEP